MWCAKIIKKIVLVEEILPLSILVAMSPSVSPDTIHTWSCSYFYIRCLEVAYEPRRSSKSLTALRLLADRRNLTFMSVRVGVLVDSTVPG